MATKKLDATRKYKTAKKNMAEKQQCVESQDQIQTNDTKGEDDVEEVLKEFMEMRVLDTVYEEEERSWASPDAIQTIKDPEQAQSISQINLTVTEQCAPFKQLLEFTPNQLVQTKNFQKIEKTGLFETASKFIRKFTKSTVSPVSNLPVLQAIKKIKGCVKNYS